MVTISDIRLVRERSILKRGFKVFASRINILADAPNFVRVYLSTADGRKMFT